MGRFDWGLRMGGGGVYLGLGIGLTSDNFESESPMLHGNATANRQAKKTENITFLQTRYGHAAVTSYTL